MTNPRPLALRVLLYCICCTTANASTVVFFNSSQVATNVASGVTSDTISSNGYLFTYTRDKLFTGGGSEPIGRYVRIPWPEGLEAQAVTAGPSPGKAKVVISRVDSDVFDLTAFTAKLLANTAGAGGAIEIMPSLNGQDGFNDPLYFDATGYYGQTFSYDTSPNYLGSTALLAGFDQYSIDLYVDFALTALTLEGAPIPGPLGDYNGDNIVDAADYVVWRTNGGTQADYNVWRSHFGQTAGSGADTLESAAVPEPTSILVLTSASWCFRRRRKA